MCVIKTVIWRQQTQQVIGPEERCFSMATKLSKYELWEVKFLGYMRLEKLYDVFVRVKSEKEPPDEERQADAFGELVQCLDDGSLSLVIRIGDTQAVLPRYSKGKPRVVALYTELTSSLVPRRSIAFIEISGN